jgi:hypothetical protein
MAARQPEQQQQSAFSHATPCPTCKQAMKMVGRESRAGTDAFNLLTFQCSCGQVIATMVQ